MFKHFKESIFVTIFGFIAAYFWAEHILPGSGPKMLFVTFFLSVLEVTLSFDNAVVNAMILEKMTPVWQHRFLTWGILVAVFGMRFLFPVIIVSIFAHLGILDTIKMAIEDVTQYTHYLHIAHAPLVAFGGAFLSMVGFQFFFNENEEPWIKGFENLLLKCKVKFLDVILTAALIFGTQFFVSATQRKDVIISGIIGIISYLIVRGLCNMLEKNHQKKLSDDMKNVATGGFMMFMYIELIDASFSLDGILGSFAISKDIIIITIGLAIGAMFVRSLTLLLVEKKTLKQYVYLSAGAHYAILTLAIIMFISTFFEVPEVVTGSLGLIFVGSSFIASLIENKREEKTEN